MLGSILGGSHAYKSLDVVFAAAAAGETCTRDEKTLKMKKKMNDKR